MHLRRQAFGLALLVLCGACAPAGARDQRDPGGGGDADSDADGDGDGDADPSWDGGPGYIDAAVCVDVIDVVFVLDVSSSMTFVLDALEAEISRVVDRATALAPEPHFGLVTFADNWALDRTGGLDDGAVHTQAATLQQAFRNVKSIYTLNDRNPGDGPDGPTSQNPICEENALDALHAAADEFPWRENATKVVILATDDTFLERPDNYGDRDGDGQITHFDFPSEGDYPAEWTVPETVQALQGTRARVFSFTRLQPPGMMDFLTRCGTGRRLPWADITDGWTTDYAGQPPIPQATDGANFDLDDVRDGVISMSDTINDVVVQSYCDPPDFI
jgi:hypothetical protein